MIISIDAKNYWQISTSIPDKKKAKKIELMDFF